MELQGIQDELERQGVGLVGISYDSPEVLRAFATAKGIRFPLLSDQGSRVITELGLLDRDLEAHHAQFGVPTKDSQQGVAYPAVFVLDAAGRVVQKRIKENYRAREGGLKLLADALDLKVAAGGPAQESSGPHLRVSVATDRAEYVRWQQSRLRVAFEVDPGWHVYGRPIPDGYVPVTVDVKSIPEVSIASAEYPEPRQFRVEGLDEDFNVNEGRFEVRVPFAVNLPPKQGPVDLEVQVRYQACSEAECLPPATLTFELRLDEGPPA